MSEFTNGRIPITFVCGDAGEGARYVVRACVRQPSGIEQVGYLLLEVRAATTIPVRENPLRLPVRYGEQKFKSRLADWTGGAAGLRRRQSQARAHFIDLLPTERARFLPPPLGHRDQPHGHHRRQVRGLMRLQRFSERPHSAGDQHAVLRLGAAGFNAVVGGRARQGSVLLYPSLDTAKQLNDTRRIAGIAGSDGFAARLGLEGTCGLTLRNCIDHTLHGEAGQLVGPQMAERGTDQIPQIRCTP